MGDLARLGSTSIARGLKYRRPSALSTAAWTLLSFITLSVGAVLAVIFAATLACVLVLATMLLGLAALTVRAPRRVAAQSQYRASGRPAHAWIAYQWDRPQA